ncbi:transcriptional regulator [Bacteroides nordii]|mgnify:CR=1 FL=1|uniref:transcriptional regulator n=1 Tax=Bacteroides nordii TaxID=291645 RepID=UPI00399C4279
MQEKTENNTKTIHRLSEYITNTGTSFNKLALELGVSNSYFSKMLKNGGSVGSDIIENILRIYPNLNANWLLTGEGSMLCENIERSILPIVHQDSTGEASAYYKMYKEKDAKVEELLKENGRLEERIRQLESQNKESDSHSMIDKVAEAFTSESSSGYGEDFMPAKPPSDSKRSSAGKV